MAYSTQQSCTRPVFCLEVRRYLMRYNRHGRYLNELIYERLKSINAGRSEIKGILTDHTHHLIRIREDINNLRGDALRRERLQAQSDLRLERIETRLDLNEA